MQFDPATMADWLNNACVLDIIPDTKSIAADVIASGETERYNVRAKLAVEAGGKALPWAEFRLTASIADTTTPTPYLIADGHLMTLTGVPTIGDTFTVDTITFEVHDTLASIGAGNEFIDVADCGSATLAATAFMDAINTASVRKYNASKPSATTVLIKGPGLWRLQESVSNCTAKASPTMEQGVAKMQVVRPAGTYNAAEAITVTWDNFTAPDGRTLTGGTSVATFV